MNVYCGKVFGQKHCISKIWRGLAMLSDLAMTASKAAQILPFTTDLSLFSCVHTSYQFLSSNESLFEQAWLVKIRHIVSKLSETLSKSCAPQPIFSSRQIYEKKNSCQPSRGAFQVRCHHLLNVGAWGICGNHQSTCNTNQDFSSLYVQFI